MLDSNGFKRPSYDELLEDLKDETLKVLGYDMNVSDTGNVGKLLKIVAYMLDKAWQDIEGSYLSGYISTATGVSLDRVATNTGFVREMDIASSVTVTFVGEAGYVIAEGFEVSTEDNIIFYTTVDATIGDDGMVDVICRCEESGLIGNVGAGKITTVVQPVAEIVSVANYNPAEGGKDRETDAEFRERLMNGTGTTTGSTINSMLTALLELSGVMSATVISNDTSEIVDGRPPHSFEAYVYGGSEAEIANTIFDKKPIGIQPLGTTSVNVSDIAGQPHTVGFSRPTLQRMYVKAYLITTEEFTSTDELRTEIIRYIGGLDADQSYYYGLKMNDICVYTQLVNIIMSFKGVKDVELSLSADNESWVTSNIVPTLNNVLETHFSNVLVEVE